MAIEYSVNPTQEVSIVYFDGDGQPLRRVRGFITNETEHFITLKSGNLTLQIGKRYVIRIERWLTGGRQ